MPRPAIRTRQLLLDDALAMRALFGSARNAYERLGLDGVLTFLVFKRALQWRPVQPAEVDQIAERWAAWRARFLRDTTETHFTLES